MLVKNFVNFDAPTDQHKEQKMSSRGTFLNRCGQDEDDLFSLIVTEDETWINPEKNNNQCNGATHFTTEKCYTIFVHRKMKATVFLRVIYCSTKVFQTIFRMRMMHIS